MLDSLVDKSTLSVDWDTRALRIVHARIRGQSVNIDQVLSVAIPPDVRITEAESIGTFIGRAVAKAKIGTKRVAVDIPRERVNFHTLKLPNASLDDLAGMVAFQIPKELHFPIDQAVVDFTVPLEKAAEGDTNDVLVAAVHKEELQFYRDVFEHAGLKLQRVGLRPNANQFAVNALLKATPYDRVLFVDVGPTTTEIDVLHQGHLVFSRAADVEIPARFDPPSSVADVDAVSAEQGLTLLTSPVQEGGTLGRIERELMIEVTRSIEAYRADNPGGSIEHAVIGGSCDIEDVLSEAIQTRFKITAQPYNPATCFGWDADRGSAAGAFAATLGLVLSQAYEPQLKFDFLSPKKPVSQAARRIRRAPMAAATAVLFVVAGIVFYVTYLSPQNEMRDELRANLAKVEESLEEHEEFIELVGAIQDYEKHRIVWIDELHELVSALPDDKQIVLDGIDMSWKNQSMKIPFRGKDIKTGSEAAAMLRAFHLADSERRQFDVKLGDSNPKGTGKYPYSGRFDIKIVDREWPDGKKKRR